MNFKNSVFIRKFMPLVSLPASPPKSSLAIYMGIFNILIKTLRLKDNNHRFVILTQITNLRTNFTRFRNYECSVQLKWEVFRC